MFSNLMGLVPYDHMGKIINVPDLSKHWYIPDDFKHNPVYYIPYTIADTDRLDIIANNLYDNPDYWSLILAMNDMSGMKDWPIPDAHFDSWFDEKYGLENSVDVHHYVDPNGAIVDPLGFVILGEVVIPEGGTVDQAVSLAIRLYKLTPVYLYDYHRLLNENKREIKLLLPEYVDSVIVQIQDLMNA